MVLQKICNFVLFWLLASAFAFAEVSFRTYSDQDFLFVSVDFNLQDKEHLTAPIGKGKSLAPKCSWGNAELLETYWPEGVNLNNPDGSKSEYQGYLNRVSVIYKLKINQANQPITYDLFYVKCNNEACLPCSKTGELPINGLLPKDEIDRYVSKDIAPSQNLSILLLFGLLGGIILNFMPCVFPIISIKIFSFVKSSTLPISQIRKQSLAFALGIISTILTIGGGFILIKSSFPGLNWGFFMQSPVCVFFLLIVFVLAALHFWDVFTFSLPLPRQLRRKTQNLYLASFFSGALTAITSSVCAGPFSGIALSSAILCNNVVQSVSIFCAIGIGIALPFVLLSIFPRFISYFPKPGAWLNTFKKLMGFAMMFSCLWPISVLLSQLSHELVIRVLIAVFFVILILWILNHDIRKYVKYSLYVALIILGVDAVRQISQTTRSYEAIEWQEYSEELLNKSLESDQPVFLNFTASWCMNCQFNQRIFNDSDIIEIFKTNKIVPIKCDITIKNEKVNELLKRYNAATIPLYIFYAGNGLGFKTLPSILTKNIVMQYIKENKDTNENR